MLIVVGLTGFAYLGPKLRRTATVFEPLNSLPSGLATLPDSPTLPLLSALVNFSLVSPNAPPGSFDYVICATPSHEGPFLVEWLTWHRLVGIQRFYLFDNAPSAEMRELLRPWLEEGSVVLYELDYRKQPPIRWQRNLMTHCENLVLPRSSWVIHIDVDEFMHVSPPGWSSPLPTFDRHLGTWEFPLHRLLRRKDIARAVCVPVPRIAWFNLGLREWGEGMLVTETHLQREVIRPGRISHGKVFLHSNHAAGKVVWDSPHACTTTAGGLLVDSQGTELKQPYPAEGFPLPQEGIIIAHYGQRSLENCYAKVDVLEKNPYDWRTKWGKKGCARDFIPNDAQLSDVDAFPGDPQGEWAMQREDGVEDGLLGDSAMRESWEGRMARVLMDEWEVTVAAVSLPALKEEEVKAAQRGTAALRPVTIHQIATAEQPHPDAEFQISGKDVKDVTFVACIRTITRATTALNIIVEDGTGMMDVRQWIQQGDDEEDGLEENVYVRILGTIKVFGNKRSVTANHINLVQDKNEIQFHICEVTYAHLMLTRGPPNGSVPHQKTAAPTHGGANPYNAAETNGGGGGGGDYGDFRGVQSKIMHHIGSFGDDPPQDGINTHAIARAINSDVDTVRRELEGLISDGHLYTTIDDEHVLST